jgi:hypothetical protein
VSKTLAQLLRHCCEQDALPIELNPNVFRIPSFHSRAFNRDGRAERAAASKRCFRFTLAALIREAMFALDCGCPSGRVEGAGAQIKIAAQANPVLAELQRRLDQRFGALRD